MVVGTRKKAGVFLVALLAWGGSGCAEAFPSGSVTENLTAAFLLFNNFQMTPNSGTSVAAGATYQFRLSGGVGGATYSVSDCTGYSMSSSGLFQAPATDATCIVTGTDSIGTTKTHTIPVRTYPTLVKSHSPHAYLRLEGDALDSSTNANNGAVVGGPLTFAAGALNSTTYAGNQAATLNGTTQYINGITTVDPSAAASAQGFSAEAWFQLSGVDSLVQAGSLAILGQEACTTGTNRIWLGVDAANRDQISTFLGGTTTRSGIVPTIGTWYHAVVTVRGSSLKLYVNGVLRTSASVSVEACNGGMGNIAAGFLTGSPYFPGLIDEVAVYQTELSAADVAQHYLTGLAQTVAVDGVSTIAALGYARTFAALGGQSSYTYAIANTVTGGQIETGTGLYTSPSRSSSSAVQATETVRATDAHGNMASLSFTVGAFPISFATLSSWYSAEVITDKTDGADVQVLFDASGVGNNLTQILGTKPQFVRPSSGPNSKPAINFPGPDGFFGASGFGTTGDVTIFVLARRNGASGTLVSYDGGVSGLAINNINYQVCVTGTNRLRFASEDGAGVQTMRDTGVLLVPAPLSPWFLVGAVRTSGPTNVVAYFDDQSENLGGMPTPTGGGSSLARLGFAGEPMCAGNAWPGQIAEAVIFHRALSATEIDQVRCYFKQKYGLTWTLSNYCPP